MTARASRLVVEHLAFAERVGRQELRGFWRQPVDYEDGMAAAVIGLCEAAAKYVDGPVPFTAFALIRIRGAIADWRRKNHVITMKKASRGVAVKTVPFAMLDPDDEAWDENRAPWARLPYAEAQQEDAAVVGSVVGRAARRLDRRHRKILIGVLRDRPQKDLARDIDVTPSRVAQMMHVVRAAVAEAVAC